MPNYCKRCGKQIAELAPWCFDGCFMPPPPTDRDLTMGERLHTDAPELDSPVALYRLPGGLTGDPYQRLANRISEEAGEEVCGFEVAFEHIRRRRERGEL